jgi:hypothetical protein
LDGAGSSRIPRLNIAAEEKFQEALAQIRNVVQLLVIESDAELWSSGYAQTAINRACMFVG